MPTTPNAGWHLWVLHSPTGPVEAHVVPIGDIREHKFNSACWCTPNVEQPHPDHPPMYTHNAADMREVSERGVAN